MDAMHRITQVQHPNRKPLQPGSHLSVKCI
jgi:hypothetical protein